MEETKEFTYSKTEARKMLLSRREKITDRQKKTLDATNNILPMLSGNVMVYIPIGSELSTVPLIEALKCKKDITILAPYTQGEVITPKKLLSVKAADRLGNMPLDCYGEAADIDMCVTPLVGINSNGYRLGYGKGCYDRFFANNAVKKIGFCFCNQIIDFTHSHYDVPLDVCVTEKNVIYFSHANYCGKI